MVQLEFQVPQSTIFTVSNELHNSQPWDRKCSETFLVKKKVMTGQLLSFLFNLEFRGNSVHKKGHDFLIGNWVFIFFHFCLLDIMSELSRALHSL